MSVRLDVFTLILFLVASSGRTIAGEVICRDFSGASGTEAAPLGVDLTSRYQYAPDRRVDVRHIKLDVTPDFEKRTIAATASVTVVPIAKPVEVLRLDARDLSVSKVWCQGAKIADFSSSRDDLQIGFVQPVAPGTVVTVHIAYTAQPQAGLYFRTPAMGYPQTDTHLWTQGEAHEARYWFPCFDYPNERASTEILCHVPTGMTVLSNGRRLGESTDNDGRKVVHWLQEKPHASYLICLVAGYFKKLEKRHRDIPLGFYTQPSLFEHAANSFHDTPDIMAFYEQEIGVPFPWNKYDQVTIEDFTAGGMENTTLTTLTHRTIFTQTTENIRTTRRLDAHEMAHQWFGDFVTCKDWSHLWLNEGFATFYAHLYEGHKFGRDALLYGLYRDAEGRILSRKDDKKPIVYRGYKNAMEQFDYRSYPKGSWVLYMLRCQLGPDLYRKCIKTYLEKHAFGSVVSDDLREVIEQCSGRPMDRFFDQWIYHARFPDLKISYQWMMRERQAKVTVRQTQTVSDDVLLFTFPVTLRFIINGKAIDHAVVVDEQKEDFFVPLDDQPSVVRFDPDYTVLANVQFDKSTKLLAAQLANQDDMMGRLLACKVFADRRTHEVVSLLEQALARDPFYGVRIVAAESLAKHGSDEAYQVLEQNWRQQKDARVRLEVVRHITGRFADHVPALIAQILSEERNPAIQAVAIKALGTFHGERSRKLIVTYLNSQSFRNELAAAAVAAIRQQRDPVYKDPLMDVLTKHESRFTSRDFGQGLQALAGIARQLSRKDGVREFLTRYLDHPKATMRISAMAALGELDDPRAIPILESFVESRDERAARAAKQAIEKLNESKPAVPAELVELRKTMATMKKEAEQLKSELQQVQSQLKAGQK